MPKDAAALAGLPLLEWENLESSCPSSGNRRSHVERKGKTNVGAQILNINC
jgi:hypothetical protein